MNRNFDKLMRCWLTASAESWRGPVPYWDSAYCLGYLLFVIFRAQNSALNQWTHIINPFLWHQRTLKFTQAIRSMNSTPTRPHETHTSWYGCQPHLFPCRISPALHSSTGSSARRGRHHLFVAPRGFVLDLQDGAARERPRFS